MPSEALPSYFIRRGDHYESTPLTRGPWSPDLQHAGPACALLAGAIERHPFAAGMHVARLTFDLLRALPLAGQFSLALQETRTGRKVRGLEALLSEAGRPLVRASALLVRRSEVPVPLAGEAPLVPPDAAEPWSFPFFTEAIGYHTSMELRRASGTFGRGRMHVWFRLLVSIVDTDAPSPLQRVIAAADSGNGTSVALDLARYSFVNPDLSVALHRLPVGEWIGIDARTDAACEGLGLADTRLWDAQGAIGRGMQSLLIEDRTSPDSRR
jgi:hypothetical protein